MEILDICTDRIYCIISYYLPITATDTWKKFLGLIDELGLHFKNIEKKITIWNVEGIFCHLQYLFNLSVSVKWILFSISFLINY